MLTLFKFLCGLSVFKPKPKFDAGMLPYWAGASSSEEPEVLHLAILSRRFVRRTGDKKKSWVYDGIVVRASNERIRYVTSVNNIPEENLCRFP